MDYSYRATEIVKINTTKDTEPAFQYMFAARSIKKKREKDFDPTRRNETNVFEYLDSIREEIHLRLTSLRHQAYEIGRLFCEVKSSLPHGGFDSWVEDNFKFSKSTAINFMNVYKACMGSPGLVEYFKPSVLYEICAPRFPEDLREELFNDATGVYDLSQREILEVSLKWRKGEVGLDSPEVQNLLKKQKDQGHYKRYKIELDGLKDVLKTFLKKFESLNEKHIVYPLIDKKDNAKDAQYFAISIMIQGFIGEVDAMQITLNPENRRRQLIADITPTERNTKDLRRESKKKLAQVTIRRIKTRKLFREEDRLERTYINNYL